MSASASSPGASLFDRYPVVDVDAHITEPPDLWTSRLPAKWREHGPRMERIDGRDTWVLPGTEYRAGSGSATIVGRSGSTGSPGPRTR